MVNLNESTLKRIKHWVDTKEIAGVSAFRNQLTNVTKNTVLDKEVGETYSKEENRQRSVKLRASLATLGYGVNRVAGTYVEGGKEVQEESYIVVNLEDAPNFKRNIFKLSEYFNQNAFLYKPKDSEIATLVGTNEDAGVGYGKEKPVGNFYEKVNETFMSRLGAQGFAFSLDDEDNPLSKQKSPTFADRKAQRINQKVNEHMIKILGLEIFDRYEIVKKRGCHMNAVKVLEYINKNEVI